jgi:hypothetical protein
MSFYIDTVVVLKYAMTRLYGCVRARKNAAIACVRGQCGYGGGSAALYATAEPAGVRRRHGRQVSGSCHAACVLTKHNLCKHVYIRHVAHCSRSEKWACMTGAHTCTPCTCILQKRQWYDIPPSASSLMHSDDVPKPVRTYVQFAHLCTHKREHTDASLWARCGAALLATRLHPPTIITHTHTHTHTRACTRIHTRAGHEREPHRCVTSSPLRCGAALLATRVYLKAMEGVYAEALGESIVAGIRYEAVARYQVTHHSSLLSVVTHLDVILCTVV